MSSEPRDLNTLFKASRTGALALLLIGAGLSSDLSAMDPVSGVGAFLLTFNFLATLPAQRRGYLKSTPLSAGGWKSFAFRSGVAAQLALLLFAAFDEKLFGVEPYPLFLCWSGVIWLSINLAEIRNTEN